jgi:hypothetical protein
MGRKSRITAGKSSPSGIPRLPKGAMQDRIITRELCASKIVENLAAPLIPGLRTTLASPIKKT